MFPSPFHLNPLSHLSFLQFLIIYIYTAKTKTLNLKTIHDLCSQEAFNPVREKIYEFQKLIDNLLTVMQICVFHKFHHS